MYGSKNNSICIQFFKIDYIQSSKTENKMRMYSDKKKTKKLKNIRLN